MNKKTWIIFAVIVAALLGALIYWSNNSQIDLAKVNSSKIITANSQNGKIADHVRGNKNSKVVLVEYGDFQCSGCGSFYPTMEKIYNEYKDSVAFVFRNYRLTSIHPNATAAAEAVEAAGLQNNYWAYYQTLYSKQDEWTQLSGESLVNIFTSYAKDLKLNTTQFKSDLYSDRVSQKLAFDKALGDKANLTETPFFILNGKHIDDSNWSTQPAFEKTLSQAIKTAN